MQSDQKELTQPQLTSFSQALPANVPALLESVWALMTNVTDGRSASESFASLNPDGVFLKTYQGCCQLMLDGSLEIFSDSWPKSGMMLAGQCMQPPTLAHLTSVKDCASWRSENNWATPNTMDSLPSRSFEAMKRQATNGGRKNRSYPGNLREQIDPLMQLAYDEAKAEANNWNIPKSSIVEFGGELNADWVDCLQGYPVGWTETKLCGAFDLFRERSPLEVFSQPWPSRRGEPQHEWEPLRVATGQKGRVARIKILGNAVVPQWAYVSLHVIAAIESEANP